MGALSEEAQIKTILVPVDGSNYSEMAVRYACAISGPLSAKVILLHVVPMTVSDEHVTDQPFMALQKVGEDILNRAKRLASSLNCEFQDAIDHGDPADRIIDIAGEWSVDLIILGSRGMSGLKRLFVGSISDKVANRAPCPVMIVR